MNTSQYIDSFPEKTKKQLELIRKIIKEELPGAVEGISYQIPVFKIDGKFVVYFAGFKKHVSIYPASDEMEKEVEGVSKYRKSKGTLQFPLDEQLPVILIRKVVRFLLKKRLD